MKKQIIDFINDLKENEEIADFLKKVKENKYVALFINKFGKSKYVTQTITTIFCLIIAIFITVSVKSVNSNKVIDKTAIATNVAETDFYDAKYDQAIEEYTKMQEKDKWPIWNAKIAEIYSVKGEFVKSNDLIQKVYESRNNIIDKKNEKIDNLQEKDKELANYITFTSFMNGEYKKAQEYGEMFLQEYPTDKPLLKTMFTVYLVNGQNDKAKEMIQDYNDGDVTANDLVTLARMNVMINNFDEAFTLLKNAWDKDKDETRVLNVVAQMADYDKNSTLDKIAKLQKNQPNEVVYKMWTAKIYSMSKDSTDKANKLVEELNNQDVGTISLNLIKANIYNTLGDSEKLNGILEEISKDNSDSYIGSYAAAWLDYNKEDYDDAFEECEKSVVSNRDYANIYAFLIPKIMEKQDKDEEAEGYFRTALYKDPLNYEILAETAKYYGQIVKSSSRALSYYNLLIKINPKDADIYYNMALIKSDNKRDDEAIDLVKKSISMNDKEAKYHRALGTVYLNKGKNDDAIKEIRTAYNLDKNDIKTLNNAGCYYISVEGDVGRGMANLKAAYDGINDKTDTEDKNTITENYERIKNLSDTNNKKNGVTLKVSDLQLFY